MFQYLEAFKFQELDFYEWKIDFHVLNETKWA